MSQGPGFGNSCLRRSVPSDRWPGSPWLLRICLGLYYIALSKEICHRKPVKGSFNPSPGEWCGSTLRLCDQSLLSCPPCRAHGMLGRGPALCRLLQTVRGRSLRPLACEIWQSKSRSQTGTAWAQPLHSLSRQGRTERRVEGALGSTSGATRGLWHPTLIRQRLMTRHHRGGIHLLQAGPS